MSLIDADSVHAPPESDLGPPRSGGEHKPLSVAEIARRHHAALLSFLRTRLRVAHDADDIAQESFLRLMRYEGSRAIGSPASMLFRIAINVARDRGRTALARRSQSACALDDVELISDLPSAERDLAASQELDVLIEAIEKLSPKCREVFLLSRLQSMTYPEIARARGISAGMVEKHISRALAVCARRLQEAARPARAALLAAAAALGLQALAARPADAAVHELNASPATVHRGFLDASLPPVLTINSGDVVRLTTSTGNPRYFEHLGVPKEKIPAELFAEYAGVDNDGRGDHTLDGPIFVRGAEPGDALEIRILKVAVRLPIAAMSFRPQRGVLPDEFNYEKDRVFWIDMKDQTIEFAPGIHVPVKPFWGVIAVAPEASRGRVGSGPPDVFGGNLDNRDLCAGASLFLPVQTRGGLVSIGDGHAAQGEGEVGLSAVEASLRGEVQIILHKGMKLRGPRAETPTHYMTIGLDPDLDVAAHNATRDMVSFLSTEKGLSRDDAYMLSSAAMDLIISEAVDGTKSVHAMIPKGIFH